MSAYGYRPVLDGAWGSDIIQKKCEWEKCTAVVKTTSKRLKYCPQHQIANRKRNDAKKTRRKQGEDV